MLLDIISEINKTVQDSINSVFSENSPLLKSIADAVVQQISVEIDARFKKHDEEMQEMRCETEKLRQSMLARTDALEQYTRKNSVRIFGINEEADENTTNVVIQFFNGVMKLNINPESIDRCHRLRLVQEGKVRPIIVKFTRYEHKRLVMVNRKILKGSTIIIAQDLTKTRLECLKAAQAKYGKKNAWSWDGRINASNKQKKILFNKDML